MSIIRRVRPTGRPSAEWARFCLQSCMTMKKAIPPCVARRFPVRIRMGIVALTLCWGLGALSARAQEAITGIVTNAATGRVLEGARVKIQGTNKEAITDSHGVYSISDAGAGSIALSVSYTGLDTVVTPLVVAAGRANRHDVGLTAEIYKMGQFVVAGEREGNAQAITLQRLSSGIKSVVSTDAFGDLAGNPAELLVRLPGVEGETQDGDVRVVRIRGVNQNLTSITMDGNRLPDAANVGGNREFTFQTVSSETFERMEVVKSPTPDMAGDSIGGAVNMVSKSGFDSSAGRRVRLSFGGTWRPFDSRPTRAPRNYTLSYSEVFGGKLAVALNVGYRGIYNPQDVMTQLHEAVPNGSSAPGYTYSVAFNDSREEQCRQGGGLRLDYKLNGATRFFFNTNRTKNIEHQGDRYATFSTNQIVATRDAAGNLTGAGGIIPGYTEKITQVRPIAASNLAMRSYTAYKQGKTTTYQLGAVHRFKTLEIDYDGYTSTSKSYFAGQRSLILNVPNIGFTVDRTADKYFPTVTQTAGPDITKIESYTGNTYSIGRLAGWDKLSGVTANAKKKFVVLDLPVFVKAGLKTREHWRQNENNSWSGAYLGADGVQGLNAATGRNDDNWAQFGFVEPGEFTTRKTRYPGIPHPAFPGRTNTRLDDTLANSPQLFRRNIAADLQNHLIGDQTFKENVDAAYLMGNVDIRQLTILAGLRVERTKVTGEGALQAITPAERARRAAFVGALTDAEIARRTIAEYSGRQTRTGKYTTLLPGIHLKYSPFAKLVTRFSYAENIGRPNVGSLIPRTTVDYDNSTISSSNPSLKPQTAKNYDLSAEYYFEPAGTISVGVFRKDLRQFIYTASGVPVPAGADNGFNGDYVGFTQTTQFNGGSARVQGLEVNFAQQFTSLPGFWAGFGAFANYTRMTTKGNYGAGNAISLTPNPVGKIAGFNPMMANAGISYIRNRVTLRLSANHRGRFLATYNAVESRQLYRVARTQVDLKMLYQVSKRADVYLDVNNLLNGYDRQSEFEGGRPSQAYYLSPSLIFGTNVRL